jgi:Deltex C-terminal domain
VYGRKTGDCPDGAMTYCGQSRDLDGYPGCGSIKITYDIYRGTRVICDQACLLKIFECSRGHLIEWLHHVNQENYVNVTVEFMIYNGAYCMLVITLRSSFTRFDT